ncbi:DUF937 domain-containing protein [Mesorhizobium sp. YM1C-6-2]|nr:DUF937 domain-containing protein [Mesorhizobium sp. YM1C-6-2]
MANLGKLAIAALGILAYQNRDKLGEVIRSGLRSDPNDPQGGFLDRFAEGTSGTPLGELLERFRSTGAGQKVDSWIRQGPNEPLDEGEVEAAIDDETLSSLSIQTGLSKQELVARITGALPAAVDRLSPEGELPRPKAVTQPSLLDEIPPRD